MVDAQDFSLRWTRTYDGDDYDDDSGNGVAVAADGSIYVTGATFVRAKGMKFLLLKYSSSGAPRWVRTYNRAAYDASWGLGVAVAADGSIYVTGHDSGKLLLRKYSPDGALRWAGAYNPSTQEDAGHGVAVAADGSVYVTGSIGIPEHGSGLPSHDEHLLSTPYGVHESGPTSDVLLLKYK